MRNQISKLKVILNSKIGKTVSSIIALSIAIGIILFSLSSFTIQNGDTKIIQQKLLR